MFESKSPQPRLIDELELSIRAHNVLKRRLGLVTVDQALKLTEPELLRVPRCGRTTASEIVAILQEVREGRHPSPAQSVGTIGTVFGQLVQTNKLLGEIRDLLRTGRTA